MFIQNIPTPSEQDIASAADSAKVAIDNLAHEFVQNPNAVLSQLMEHAIQFGLKLLAAIAIYLIGAWIIKRVKKVLRRIFLKRRTEATISSFVISLVSILLTVLLVIITIGTLGINTTSIAALLAAGGMAIGMALSGTVQNFAGGIMILVFKPFKAGDFISVQGFIGTVKEVSIVSTTITTPDNRDIVLPNGALSNGTIDNYSANKYRRVEWVIGFSYGIDVDKCMEELLNLLKQDERVLSSETPGAWDPYVVLGNLGTSSVDLKVRAWVRSEDFVRVFYDYNKVVYSNMPAKGFTFPFPQMDVHVKN